MVDNVHNIGKLRDTSGVLFANDATCETEVPQQVDLLVRREMWRYTEVRCVV